jgi:hypothetical protein
MISFTWRHQALAHLCLHDSDHSGKPDEWSSLYTDTDDPPTIKISEDAEGQSGLPLFTEPRAYLHESPDIEC